MVNKIYQYQNMFSEFIAKKLKNARYKLLDPILEQKIDVVAERIFGTIQDSDQIPITKESGEKLNALTRHWIKYRTDDNGYLKK